MDTKPLHVLDGYSNNLLQNPCTYRIAKYFSDTYKNMSHYVAGLTVILKILNLRLIKVHLSTHMI